MPWDFVIQRTENSNNNSNGVASAYIIRLKIKAFIYYHFTLTYGC